MDWTFYVKQGRALGAWSAIRPQGLGPDACGCVYPLAMAAMALDDPWNAALCQAVVLLTEMMGCDSHPLRITLAVLDRLAKALVIPLLLLLTLLLLLLILLLILLLMILLVILLIMIL